MKYNIEKFKPCSDGKEWYDSQPDTETAWGKCPRGDWMLWVAARVGIDRRLLCKAAALSANTVRHLMTDKRSTDAIDTVLVWCDGNASIEDVKLAARAADYAARAADYAAAVAAADAAYAADAAARAADYAAADAAADAADAADAAADAAYAAVAAADAAYAAADAAARAADYAARAADSAAEKESQLQTADICREILTDAVMKRIQK